MIIFERVSKAVSILIISFALALTTIFLAYSHYRSFLEEYSATQVFQINSMVEKNKADYGNLEKNLSSPEENPPFLAQ